MSEVDPFAALSDDERALLRPAPRADRVQPMKAVLTDERFSDPDWIFERKLDGIRCMAIKAEQRVRLLSRNDLSLNSRFPAVVDALERDTATDLVIDGEVVAFDGARTSFERLQQRGERDARRVLLRLRPPLPRRSRHRPRSRCERARRCSAARWATTARSG